MSPAFRVIFFFTAAYFLSYFYRSANAIIAPDLTLELGLTAAELGLITSLFFASLALVQLPLGMALDRWGARWVTSLLMLVSVLGSLIFAAANSLPALALGRTLIGVGMAGVLMGALKAFSQWFSPRRYATVSSLLIGIGSTGALAASTPLVLMQQAFGWRSVFLIGAFLIAAVAFAMMFWTRSAPPGRPGSPPAFPASGAERAAQPNHGSWRTIFGSMHFWRIVPLIFFSNGTFLSFHGLWSGPYLFDVLQLEKITAGNILLLLGVGVTTGYLICGWLSDRFGLARVIVFGSSMCITSQVILALRPSVALGTVAMLIFGVFGAFAVMLLVQPRSVFPANMMGRAVTAVNVFSTGGTFILQWVMGLIISSFSAGAQGSYPPEAHSAALWFTAAGTFIALIWYLPMLRFKAAPETGPSPIPIQN